jgi:hypothetical protein
MFSTSPLRSIGILFRAECAAGQRAHAIGMFQKRFARTRAGRPTLRLNGKSNGNHDGNGGNGNASEFSVKVLDLKGDDAVRLLRHGR